MLWFDKLELPPAQKMKLRECAQLDLLLTFLTSMFTYEGMDENLNTVFIDLYCSLIPDATCGVFEYKGKEYIGYATSGGLIDAYGYPVAYNLNTLSYPKASGVINGINGAICHNNSIRRPDTIMLASFAELFTLCDTAQRTFLQNARLHPIYECDNSLIQQQVEEAYKESQEGTPNTYVTKAWSKLDASGQPGLKVNYLSDYNAVDKLQYLSTYHRDLLYRFFGLFGMSYNDSAKAAQQSVAEVTSNDKTSWIIPNDRLKERKKFIEAYNKVFNHNASVRFSDAWLDAYKNYLEGGREDE